MSNRIQTGATEPIQLYVVNSLGKPLTGLVDLYIRIRRNSDGKFLDWSDMTFKTSGWTTLNKTMTEISATNAPGLYALTGEFNTSLLTNANANDAYVIFSLQTPGLNARLPGPSELQVGKWLDTVVNQTTKIDQAATLMPNVVATGSLMDRLMNKDSGKTYSAATDSLEGIRDQVDRVG